MFLFIILQIAIASHSPILALNGDLMSKWGLNESFQISNPSPPKNGDLSPVCLALAADNLSLTQLPCTADHYWYQYGDTKDTRSLAFSTAGFLFIDNANAGTVQIGEGESMTHAQYKFVHADPNPDYVDWVRYSLYFAANNQCLMINGDGFATYGTPVAGKPCLLFSIRV